MESYIVVEDLIECDAEESVYNSHAVWTEQALDMFISLLQNAIKHNFGSEDEMLQVVTNKMAHRNFGFSFEQIHYKYNSLKKLYFDKMEKKQEVEPELIKLFGNMKTNSSKRRSTEEALGRKKPKIEEDCIPPRQNKSSDEEVSFDENDKSKLIWSTESNRFFLDLLEQNRPLLGSKFKTKRQMWEEISRQLRTRGFDLTWSQVENKWKYLVRHYRNRLEMIRKNENHESNDQSKNAFPEIFKTFVKRPRKIKDEDMIISFANDQRLPFEDDGEDNEEDNFNDEIAFNFEEACSLPEVNAVSAESLDPVLVEEPNPTGDALSSNETSPQLERIVKEISYLRKDIRKQQTDMLGAKKEELKAYRERTTQFTRIGDALNELLRHMRTRDGHL